MTADELFCLDGRDDCAGEIAFRALPGRHDLKAFPRCEAHFQARLADAERDLELLADTQPRWFDAGYAGEHWH